MKTKNIFIVILLFGLVLRFAWIDSLIERDEGQFAYNAAVNYVNNNNLYKKDIFTDRKPIMTYIFYSIPIYFFGNDFFYIRLFNNFFYFLSIISFYEITKIIFKEEKRSLLSTLFFVILSNLPYLENFFVMSESIGLHFTLFGFYFLIREKGNKTVNYFFSAIFLILSVMSRLNLIINLIIIIYHLFLNRKYKYIFFLISFFSFLFITLLIFSSDFLKGVLFILYRLQTMVYVPLINWLMFLSQLSGTIILSILGLRRLDIKFKKEVIMGFALSLLIGFAPNAYGHYFISCIPFFAIFSSIGISNIIARKKKMTLFIIGIIFITNVFFSFLQYPDLNFGKYGNRIDYSDSRTREMQEEISYNLKKYKEDSILLLGWEPYVCFRSEKVGCRNYFYFNDKEYVKRINYTNIIVIYNIHENEYKRNNITFDLSKYKITENEHYSILERS